MRDGIEAGEQEMPGKFPPIDLSHLKTYPLSGRKSKVSIEDFASVWKKGSSLSDFFDSLPDLLAAADLKMVVGAMATAHKADRTIIMAMGAHVIKVGLNPVVIDLMERGVVTAVAMNGAGIIHDSELAMTGRTSEDVAAALGSGDFGMAHETGAFISRAVNRAGEYAEGLGRAVGDAIIDEKMPYAGQSILAAGARLHIPVTVHVAMGTDIVHMHPGFNPERAGGASHRDFRIFASVVATLEKGVYLNVGSAVILPEVFLKALTLVRNIGHHVENFTAVNMDFIRHYRPMTNVVNRPTVKGGRGINLVGHHEIMLPLIAAGLIEAIHGS
jgi:hypothetical protein